MPQYFQIPSTRDVQGSNFPNSNIVFPYMLSSGSWSPQDSYFRMRVEIQDEIGAPMNVINDTAPNMDMLANMFTNIKFLINGVCVEEISDYVPQICALKNRMFRGKPWLDGAGKGTNWYQHDQRERLRLVSPEGTHAGQPISETVTPMTNLEMGFDALTSVAISAAGVVTFTQNVGAAIPQPLPYKEGDYYVDTTADDEDLRLVTKILTNNGATATMQTTLKVFGNATTANAGPARAFGRIPGTYNPSYQRSAIELIWKVPLDSWKQGVYPPGKYEIILTPHPRNNIYNMAIETISRNKSQISDDPNIGFRMNVIDMYLYAYQMDDNPCMGKSQLDVQYVHTRCQTEDITAGGGLQQKSFAVNTPIVGLTVAFQDQNYASDTRRSASKFKVRPEPPQEDIGLSLRRLYLNYNHIKKPQPDSDPSFIAPNDYLTQRYFETYMNTDNPEPESKTDWIERGPYYHFNWDDTNAGGEADTKAFVYYSFTSNLQNKANILFFHHYLQNFTLELENGSVMRTHMN